MPIHKCLWHVVSGTSLTLVQGGKQQQNLTLVSVRSASNVAVWVLALGQSV